MPKRTEALQPEKIPRLETQTEFGGFIAEPFRDRTEKFDEPITKNITLAYLTRDDVGLLSEMHHLHNLCASQGLEEARKHINSLAQGYANETRGVDGKTSEGLMTYSMKQTITKTVRGEAKPKQLLGRKEE